MNEDRPYCQSATKLHNLLNIDYTFQRCADYVDIAARSSTIVVYNQNLG